MHRHYLKHSRMVCIICTICGQPAVEGRSVAVMTNKVPYLLQLEMSVSATVADTTLCPSIALHLPKRSAQRSSIFDAHLKFTVYGLTQMYT